ncbi:MAG: hypothetical protein KatS3mg090_0238 [Patescibacteria group bacterium]|nr:MAG: hypothetical protein KatS3mg090_0238 [Patescibacteria group bacterium]
MINFFLLFFLLLNIFLFCFYIFSPKEDFKLTPYLFLLGMFVKVDIPLISIFWIVSSIFALYLNNFLIFSTLFFGFWSIRSLGEVVYWLLQQFSLVKRNPPERLCFSSYFKGEAVWVVYQVFWQVILIFVFLGFLICVALLYKSYFS